MNEKWLKQFIANYEGQSPEAQSLEPFLKTTYTDAVYIPWAVMERLVYMQDPDTEFVIVKDADGNIVHTETDVVKTFSRSVDKDGERTTETEVYTKSHFVVLGLTFLGKTFKEYYPIQDNSYDAPKVINQNLVNKAIQRGKTRLASRATGLGLKLYEGVDLQFDNADSKADTENEQKISKKVTPVKPQKIKETVAVESAKSDDSELSLELLNLAEYIKETPELAKGIQEVNASVFKKYKFTISQDDSVKELAEKLRHIANPEVFLRGLKQRSGIPL